MNVFELLKQKNHIIFFNQGDRCIENFIASNDRPNFFWFHDSFYSHLNIEKQDRFLHIFIKNRDDYSFFFMQGNKTWDDVYNHFLKNKDKLNKEDNLKRMLVYNPPIIRSNDTMVPDLIFDFEKEGNDEAVCIFPEKYKGIRCKYFDKNHKPIDFIEIPELMKIIYANI
jgi:hypothetical protein